MIRISSSRRRFLAGLAALGVVASLPRRPARALPGDGRPLVPRETFFSNPDIGWARLSPDGSTVAYLAPVDGVRNLWVAPVDDLTAARPVTRVTARPLSSLFQWAYTDRHLVFFEERDGDENWRASSVDVQDGTVVPLTPERGVRAGVQEVSHRFPREMLLSHNGRDRRMFDLYRTDVVTGRSELHFENDLFAWLLTDNSFRVRLAPRYRSDGGVDWFELRPSGAWVPFLTVPIGDVDGTHLLDVGEDGRTLYLLDSRGRDKAALVSMDIATRRARVLVEDRDADIKRVL